MSNLESKLVWRAEAGQDDKGNLKSSYFYGLFFFFLSVLPSLFLCVLLQEQVKVLLLHLHTDQQLPEGLLSEEFKGSLAESTSDMGSQIQFILFPHRISIDAAV